MSKESLKRCYPARLELNGSTLALAQEAMDKLWEERQKERGLPPTLDRSGSCKFAALMARTLFGGTLVGNYEHVFVRLSTGQLLDLNDSQPDVMLLGDRAHDIDDSPFISDYRASLASCLPRVERWAGWVLNEYALAAASTLLSAELPLNASGSQPSR